MDDNQKTVLQDGITKVLQHMITANGNTPLISSRFHSHSAPAMSIGSYVERIVKYTRCSCEALVGSLMFLQYHVTFSGHCITIFNVHRMLITSVVLSAKSRDDEYYTNTYYAKIGGIPASELKTLEIEYINLLDWDCWLDRDAFEETVAMLTELAESNPSTHDIAQAVSFWEEKQSRFARTRRDRVRGAIEQDVEIEARKVSAQTANSFSTSTVASPQSNHVASFGASSFSNFEGAPNNNTDTSSAYKDPYNNSGSAPPSAASSNLVVTAPCFYPPSYKGTRQPSVAANSATGAVPKKLGINPYTNGASVGSPYGEGSGFFPNPYTNSRLNPYAQQHQPASVSSNPFAKNYNKGSNNTTPSVSTGFGHQSVFPSQPINQYQNDDANTSQSHTPVGEGNGYVPTGSPNGGKPPLVSNKPGSWASVVGTGGSGVYRSASNNPTLLSSVTNNGTGSGNSSISAQPPNGTSPSVVPQGAPGFNTTTKPSSLNVNQIQGGASFGTPHASPGGNNTVAGGTPRTANNARLLTKHRFASGDNITSGNYSNLRTPESSRYSIVGVNPNQHPNSYHFYNHTAAAADDNKGIANRAASPSVDTFGNNSKLGRGNAVAGPGIRLNHSEDQTPAASYVSMDENSNGVDKGTEYASITGIEEEGSPLGRAGSKRGASMRQSGKKREVPSHWQHDER